MPAKAEIDELRERCKWELVMLNDMKGFMVTGPNGNCNFLPAAGIWDELERDQVGIKGFYWLSSLDQDGMRLAWLFRFNTYTLESSTYSWIVFHPISGTTFFSMKKINLVGRIVSLHISM